MRKIAKQRIDSAAFSARAVLQEEVWDTVYRNEPTSYERTGEFIAQVLVEGATETDKYIKETVYFDPNVMMKRKRKNNWNAHIGFGMQDMRKALPQILNEGTNGGLYNHEGYGFMESATQKIREELDDYIIGKKRRKFSNEYTGEDYGDERTYFQAGITIKKKF